MSYKIKTNIEEKTFITETRCKKYLNTILKNATLIGLEKVELKKEYSFFDEKLNCYMWGWKKILITDFLRGL